RVIHQVRWARIATLALFLFSLSFAFWMKEMVAYLGIFSCGSFAATLTPSLALGMHWRAASRRAAASSLLVGIILSAGLDLVVRSAAVQLPVTPSLIALVASFLTFVLVGVLERKEAISTPHKVMLGS